MYTRVFMADFIHNSPNLKTIQRFNTEIDKEIVVYLYNGILLNNKKRINF